MLGQHKWYAAELLTSHILPTHMLNQLTIRNYVLVDHLDISFAPGLTGNYRGIWRWQIDFVGSPWPANG